MSETLEGLREWGQLLIHDVRDQLRPRLSFDVLTQGRTEIAMPPWYPK